MSHPKLQKKKKILSSMLRTFRAKGTLQNRQKVEKQHIYTKNDDAEFEKKVFLHIGHVLAKKMILY